MIRVLKRFLKRLGLGAIALGEQGLNGVPYMLATQQVWSDVTAAFSN